MVCYKLAKKSSLRPANFTSPYFHEAHVIICLNCSCQWKLFRQANRTRALLSVLNTSNTWQSAQSQQRICRQRRLLGCRGEQCFPFFRKLRNGSNHKINTQSQRRPFLQSEKSLNSWSYLTPESYLQVREPRKTISGQRVAQISKPQLTVSTIIGKPVKPTGPKIKSKAGCWDP